MKVEQYIEICTFFFAEIFWRSVRCKLKHDICAFVVPQWPERLVSQPDYLSISIYGPTFFAFVLIYCPFIPSYVALA